MGHHTRRGRSMVLLQDKDARDSKEPQTPDKAGRAPSQSLQGCTGLTLEPRHLPGRYRMSLVVLSCIVGLFTKLLESHAVPSPQPPACL